MNKCLRCGVLHKAYLGRKVCVKCYELLVRVWKLAVQQREKQDGQPTNAG